VTAQSLDASRWLPLLRDMTARSAQWCVWKNADNALAGRGDIDSAAPYRHWGLLSTGYEVWARSLDATAVVSCRHTPGMKSFVAVLPGLNTLFQFDVFGRTFWRGSPLFSADQLGPLTTLDARGFRRLVPGAEGVFVLLFNGVRRTGRPNEDVLRQKHVSELLQGDWEGALATARILGAPPELRQALQAFRDGSWDARAFLMLQARALGGSLLHRNAPSRLAFRYRARARPCPIVRALRSDRAVPADIERWLWTIRTAHDPRDACVFP
jgi:hypothetical protein